MYTYKLSTYHVKFAFKTYPKFIFLFSISTVSTIIAQIIHSTLASLPASILLPTQ